MNVWEQVSYRVTSRVLLVAMVALASAAVHAHHSSAIYDSKRTVSVTGWVTRFEWTNPHVYIYLAQRTGAAGTVQWLIECKPPSILRRFGWSARTIEPGEMITVTGNPSRNSADRSLLPIRIVSGDATLFGDKATAARARSEVASHALPAHGLDGVYLTVIDSPSVDRLDDPGKLTLTAKGAAAVKRFDERDLPAARCVPYTAPILMVTPDRKRITSGQAEIRIEGEFDGAERIVHMDRATHEGAPTTNQGDSVGHWEARTLVIDTTRFSDHLSGNAFEVPSGAKKHLIERLTPNPDGSSLTYHFELRDPEYLAAPITGEIRWLYRPELAYAPEQCDPNNASRYIRR